MNIQKGGLYGGIVLAVVISVAIFLTVALDVEKTEREETRYEYVADITGLFGSDTAPQYFDYDMSKSYTGYYTRESSPYVGGIEYNVLRSGQTNTYPLSLAPTVVYDSPCDLATVNVSNTVDHLAVGIYGPDGNTGLNGYRTETLMFDVNNKSLRSLLMELNLPGDTFTITMASDNRENWILFGSSYDFVSTGGNEKAMYYALPDYVSTYPVWDRGSSGSVQTLQIALSCVVHKSANTVEFYSNTDATGIPFKIVSLDYAVVMYGGSTRDPSSVIQAEYPYPLEASAVNILVTNPTQMQYLDISKGVRISTEE